MGKTYIDTVKYLIYANAKVSGLVDKPDIVGAIFGQTEGLLGDELDLRDLQKNGRIGRIEVEKESSSRGGATNAIIKIPSSLDMVETCIIAAALEAVDRVGPCEASISINKIEDTRNMKRKTLVDRAKSLLRSLLNNEIPESREIAENVRDEVKKEEITSFGPDRLPAGPGIARNKEIIIVEGRADVLNLLKNDINNVIGMQGAKLIPSIIELSKKKEITLFLDGDRGGDLILKSLEQAGAEIDYIARAPRGKEVEELSRKEMIKCLRNRLPYEQETVTTQKRVVEKRDVGGPSTQNTISAKRTQTSSTKTKPQLIKKPNVVVAPTLKKLSPPAKTITTKKVVEKPIKPIKQIAPSELMNELNELKDTLKARLYNKELGLVKEIRVRDIIKTLDEIKGISAIVFDGIVTQRLVDLSNQKGVKTIIGSKIGNVKKTPEGIDIRTNEGRK